MRKLIILFALIALGADAYTETKGKQVQQVPPSLQNKSVVDTQTLMLQLEKKQQELAERERRLKEQEAKLSTLDKDIKSREADMKKIRDEVSTKVNQARQEENKDLTKLAKVYAATKPKSAAAIMVKMDVEKSVMLLRQMSDFAAGKVMTEMGKLDPAYAAEVSMRLTPDPGFPLNSRKPAIKQNNPEQNSDQTQQQTTTPEQQATAPVPVAQPVAPTTPAVTQPTVAQPAVPSATNPAAPTAKAPAAGTAKVTPKTAAGGAANGAK